MADDEHARRVDSLGRGKKRNRGLGVVVVLVREPHVLERALVLDRERPFVEAQRGDAAIAKPSRDVGERLVGPDRFVSIVRARARKEDDRGNGCLGFGDEQGRRKRRCRSGKFDRGLTRIR